MAVVSMAEEAFVAAEEAVTDNRLHAKIFGQGNFPLITSKIFSTATLA
jgi:hypothetical protein